MAKRKMEEALSLPDRFYIENHGNLSVEQIAQDLGKPIELVNAYCQEWIKKAPKKKRAIQLMDRHTKHKGIMSMTEAASMAGDDSTHSNATLEDINRAKEDGDFELVKILKERYNKQEKEKKDVIRNVYSKMIHYIQEPDENSEVY